jgi:hypothetical protein
MKNLAQFLATGILIFGAVAHSQFNPPQAPKPSRYISCSGSGDYPNASIGYDGDKKLFRVAVRYDLDVPGGASGTINRVGTGSVSPQAISINFTDGPGGIRGVFKDGGYVLEMKPYGQFSCYVVNN